MGPFIIRLIERLGDQVVGVAVGRLRGAGATPSGLGQRWRRLRLMWLLFETRGLLHAIWVRLTWRLARLLPLRDGRSIDRAAARKGIPVLSFDDPNQPAFLEQLRALEPDLIFNQSDCILREKLLGLPRIGVVNRHGSRLPQHRGRLASYWTHAEGEGTGWVTVHFVTERIDAGPIILQQSFPISACESYAGVLRVLFERSLEVVSAGLSRLGDPGFVPAANDISQGTVNKMPTLAQAQEYRRALARRRRERADD